MTPGPASTSGAFVAGPGAVRGAVFYRATAPADLSVPDPGECRSAMASGPGSTGDGRR